jgi:hypothetical protein
LILLNKQRVNLVASLLSRQAGEALVSVNTVTLPVGSGAIESTRRVSKSKSKSRKKHQRQTPEARIAALENEIQKLQERLKVEERFRIDTQVRHFKSWLRTRPQPRDNDLAKRFLDDTRLPQHASKALYTARLKLYGYSTEDIHLFEETWKDMLFTQS